MYIIDSYTLICFTLLSEVDDGDDNNATINDRHCLTAEWKCGRIDDDDDLSDLSRWKVACIVCKYALSYSAMFADA